MLDPASATRRRCWPGGAPACATPRRPARNRARPGRGQPLYEVDVGDERLVVLLGLPRRAPGELRHDERPAVGRVLGPHHQRAISV